MAISLRWRNALIVTVAVVALLACFPPFHVTKVGSTAATPGAFNSDAVAGTFWTGGRQKVIRRATDAAVLASAVMKDPKSAAENYGRRVGLGGTTYYCVTGVGRVVAVSNGVIQIAVGAGDQPDYAIETGPLFGNTIRDGTGAFDVNSFTDSQDYNALAAALNRRVEAEILPALRQRVRVGSRLTFAGCIECNEDTNRRPLMVVPLIAEVK